MLYMQLREELRRYARAVRSFHAHIGPDCLEEVDPPLDAFLTLVDNTERSARALLRHFPALHFRPLRVGEVLPDAYPSGPVVHPDDVHLVVSVQLPLALAVDADIATESWAPVSFMREKCLLLASTVEVYDGWRGYSFGQYPTVWTGYPRQIPAAAFPGVTLVSHDEHHLSRLLANFGASVRRCEEAIEFRRGRSVDQL